MENGWRKEYKFTVSNAERILIVSKLKYVIKTDAYAKDDGTYLVRTLYFDDTDNTSLRDKTAGNPIRSKFRIRYYNNDDSFIRLEKKEKLFEASRKRSVRITKKECEDIMKGNISFMRDDERELLREFYAECVTKILKPVSTTEYIREAFVCETGDVRITLDSSVKTSSCTDAFFSKNAPGIPASTDNRAVFEIKYGDFIPDYIKRIIPLEDRSPSSNSKYEMSRRF